MGEQIPRRYRTRNGRPYGARLADCFCVPEPPSHELRTARHGVLAVTELAVDFPMIKPTIALLPGRLRGWLPV